MYDGKLLDRVYLKMIEYFAGDAKRVQHFVKVHSFAKLIGESENLEDEQLFILEAAAYVHDIGIKQAERLCGSADGKLQEKYGPVEAEKLLKACGVADGVAVGVTSQVTNQAANKVAVGSVSQTANQIASGFTAEEIERITYLVAHHHTYNNIEGLDYQILVEADFLVNFYEDGCDKKTIAATLAKIFKTDTGKHLCQTMFGI